MKILHVAGARPNFMKIAPIIREMTRYHEMESFLLHTGQHYDKQMSDVFFTDLDLPVPDVNLEVGSGSHAEQTAQILLRFEPVALQVKPDLVLVVGDVNSTLACSLVAAKLGIPIAHVEAGVRSFDRRMPEEINRVVTDALANLLFTPSLDADENLRREGISEDKIHFVGNVMVDTLLKAVEPARARQTWSRWSLGPQEYAVLTLHRVSNVDDQVILKTLLGTIVEVARKIPVVFPIHPRTQNRIKEWGIDFTQNSASNLLFVEPLGYLDFLCLMADARFVMTDSGGIQAETTMLGVPCLTLRENTEWTVTIQQGTNRLVGIDRGKVLDAVEDVLIGEMKNLARPEKWDGKAAERIVKIIWSKL